MIGVPLIGEVGIRSARLRIWKKDREVFANPLIALEHPPNSRR